MSDNFCLPKTHLLIILCIFMGITVWYLHYTKNKEIDFINKIKEKDIQFINNEKENIKKQIENLTEKENDKKQIEILKENNKIQIGILQEKEKEQDYNKKQIDIITENNKKEIKILKDNLIEKDSIKQTDNFSDIIIENDESCINKRKILEYRDAEVKYNDFKPPERRLPEYQYPTTSVKQIINIPTRGYPDNYQLMGLLLRENTESGFNLFGRQLYPGSNQYEYYAQGKLHDNQIKIPIYRRDGKELYNDDEVKIPGTDDKKGLFKVKLYKLDIPRYNPYDY